MKALDVDMIFSFSQDTPGVFFLFFFLYLAGYHFTFCVKLSFFTLIIVADFAWAIKATALINQCTQQKNFEYLPRKLVCWTSSDFDRFCFYSCWVSAWVDLRRRRDWSPETSWRSHCKQQLVNHICLYLASSLVSGTSVRQQMGVGVINWFD